MERGVVCEVTPIRLLIEGDDLLGVQRTCRGISVITPLSIRRGVGGEASVFSVCRRPSVRSKRAPKRSVNSVRSVREKTPQNKRKN